MKEKRLNNLFLLIPILILNIISLFNMVNANLINDSFNNAFLKQLIWFTIGYGIIFLIYKTKIFDFLYKYSSYLYCFSILLLILVLIIGHDINGAKCWLNLFGFSFQPSELVKVTLTLSLIKISSNRKKEKNEFIFILKCFILTIIPSVLVFLEPDTGAIINYFIILLVILFTSKLNKWWYITGFIIFFLTGTLCVISYLFFKDYLINLLGTSIFYRIDRLINFANGNSYQLENALINIGGAPLFRWGFKDILLYIPEAPTDFFFAFSIGNYGLLSGFLILLCFLILDIYLIIKTRNLNKKSKMFIYSYLGVFIFHQLYNICMNIGLLPIMGIPLPFLSYGGSSTLINFIFIGIIIKLLTKKDYFL